MKTIENVSSTNITFDGWSFVIFITFKKNLSPQTKDLPRPSYILINTRCPCTVVMKNGILSRKYIICEEKNINIVQKNFI